MAGKNFPTGSRVNHYETIDSTNIEARRLIDAGETGPLWLLANQQTAGYGRRGAQWSQSVGDVAASFVFVSEARTDQIGQLSYAAALAVYDALGQFSADAPLALKWPNDVLLGDAKISGLLLELVTRTDASPVIIFGVGVNLVSAPDLADYPAAKLIDAIGEQPPSPSKFVAALDQRFLHWRTVWEKDGFGPIRTAWLEKAARLGENILVRLPNSTLSGVFKSIDDDGALVLATDHGDELITVGSVYFGDGHAVGD